MLFRSEALSAQVAIATAGYQCAALNYTVGADRSLALSGHLATQDDIDRLKRAIDRIRGISGTPAFNVRLMIWPYCEVIGLLTPLLNLPTHDAPTLAFSSKVEEARLGECLMLDVVTPSFDSYVYIDYYAAEGEVLHLLPNRRELFNLRPPRNHFILGKSDCWRLSGTTGQQFISLVAAKKPLFPEQRHDTEGARDYIASLASALSATAQGESVASVLFFNLRD